MRPGPQGEGVPVYHERSSGRRFRYGTFLCLLLSVLVGCHPSYQIEDRLEESSRELNKMLRWRQMQEACAAFALAERRESCLAGAKGATGVEIADYRVRETKLDMEKGEATVRVELDYYVPPSNRLQTVEDVQQWRYLEADGRWWLVSPLPVFR